VRTLLDDGRADPNSTFGEQTVLNVAAGPGEWGIVPMLLENEKSVET